MASKNEFTSYTKSTSRIMTPGQGIYEESSTQKAPLGTRIAFADGRVFRYAKAGATALAAGKFVKAGALTAQVAKSVTTAVSAVPGNKTVTVTTSSAVTTANDGYLVISSSTGAGLMYKIDTCAANATTSTSTDFVLYDDVAVALATTSTVDIHYNPYEQCEVVASATDLVLGVPPIAVTAEYYFWIQTWGPATVFADCTPAAGYAVTVCVNASQGTAGTTTTLSITASGAGTSNIACQLLGYQWQVGVKDYYKLVNLMIQP